MVLPSGMHPPDLLHGNLEDNISALVVDMIMPSDCSDARRILSHARYNGHYRDEHPKWIALRKSINKTMDKESNRFKARIKIKLPSSCCGESLTR